MSKLEDLIRELCPNGVEYVRFQDVCEYVRGVTYNKAQEARFGDVSPWKIFRANNITLSANALNFDDVKLVKREVKVKPGQMLKMGDILICAGSGSKEHVGKVAYIAKDMDYTFGGFMAVIRCNKTLNSRFMFHILTSGAFSAYLSSALNSTTINNLNSAVMSNFSFPLPPLPVQGEIVRILDNFTELTAELTARRKQYNYYTSQLMNLGDSVKMLPLGEIGSVRMCKRILKSQTNTTGGIPFYKIGTFGKEPDAFISEELFQEYKEKYSYPNKGDTLISCSGTIGRTVEFNGEPAYFQDSNIVWLEHDETIVTNKYLQYCYKKKPWQISTGGTIARLYNDNIHKARIPVPPLAEQERIVAVLDRFDALCNDLTVGLPAEIEARRKQYEYYRDQLLSFKELA